jgi:excisionase family DNA binding protein
MQPNEELWTHKETAKILKVTPGTLYVWNSRGEGPPSYKIGGSRRYRRDEVAQWIAARRQAAGERGVR